MPRALAKNEVLWELRSSEELDNHSLPSLDFCSRLAFTTSQVCEVRP